MLKILINKNPSQRFSANSSSNLNSEGDILSTLVTEFKLPRTAVPKF
jgi:hypothetical protein